MVVEGSDVSTVNAVRVRADAAFPAESVNVTVHV